MKELNYLDITKTGQGHIKVPSATGIHPDMGVGTAQQIQTNIHDTNSVPYVFRPTPYNSTRESGDIVGASVAWNQFLDKESYPASATINDVTFTVGADGSISTSGQASANAVFVLKEFAYNTFPAGHKILVISGNTGTGSSATFELMVSRSKSGGGNVNIFRYGTIFEYDTSNTAGRAVQVIIRSGYDSTGLVWKPQMFDLTQMFGSTVADAIYTLESGTAGAGIAKLREWGFFDKPYYAYNAGGIESVNVSKHRMTGLNQWDEVLEVGGIDDTTGQDAISPTQTRSKNYIPVTPATNYFAHIPYAGSGGIYVYYYDGNKNFISCAYVNASYNIKEKIFQTPANCTYIRFKAQSNTNDYRDICINISDPAINGTYEPYTVNEYPLDYSLTLRGILKLDGSNNLYADGDVYEADGTVTRKYGTITLNGSESWSSGNVSNSFYTPLNAMKKLLTYNGEMTATVFVAENNGFRSAAEYGVTGYKDSGNSYVGQNWLYLRVDGITSTAALKTYLENNPITVIYPLATPTTETADPYNEVQVCSPYGTEEFVDAGVAAGTRDVSIPVGHNTEYMKNIVGAIEGIPLPPSANGTYTLKVTVASGVPTYSWVSE